jgi:predicted ATPase/class 3 adenylate cyclase
MAMSLNLPSGTVTFLFTDIEGSTILSQQYPDAVQFLLARHNQIMQQAIKAHNGYVFQVVGDSFAAAFHTPSNAIKAALDAQRNLYHEEWMPVSIKVRMGIHTGMAQLQIDSKENAYSGYATLASTQRIMSAGHGGQILLSSVTRELVGNVLPASVELIDLGEKRLKDLLRPVHIYQINLVGHPTTFPPLKTLDLFPNNLPVQLTSFVGRESEIAELKQVMKKHRLVTLTGTGGTGKTRLSLQVAVDLIERFDHGVWFIELAPLTDPDLIAQTILSIIGIQEHQGRVPLEILKDYFHDKKSLIVLDNCEHLVVGCAGIVNTLLNNAPNLKILASSREALGIKGEQIYTVPSLSMPDLYHLPVFEQLSQYEAVQLFIDRASLVSPYFDIDEENAALIARICTRLDGIPLAIELAAARVKMMSVEQISARLDDRFRLLTGGARTALPRQQTLRALVDWSYDQLLENERLLLCYLSVFAGSWNLEAAEEVCGGNDIETYDVLDLLTQLVNKSLVVVYESSHSGETRYRMLETIRQYTREKLLESGGGEMVRKRHLAFFVRLAEKAEPELYSSNQLTWLNRLDDEFDNLRTALDWALATDIESGLRIASIPWRFWEPRGHLQELEVWLREFLDQYKTIDRLHALALVVFAILFFRQGDFTASIEKAKLSLQMARTISDKQLEAFSLALLGVIIQLQGNVGEGIPLLKQALASYRVLGDKIGQANTLEWLSYDHTNLERAIAFAKESLDIHRELDNLIGIADVLCILARLSIWIGDTSSAAPWLEEALSIARQLGIRETELAIIISFGLLAHWEGNYPKAIEQFEEAISLSEKIGDRYSKLWIHIRMAHTYLQKADTQHARVLFNASLENKHLEDFPIALVYAIEGLACLNVDMGQFKRAACLFAWTDAMREQIGDHRPPIEQASVDRELEIIHSQINDIDFENSYECGKLMDVGQAITIALDDNLS